MEEPSAGERASDASPASPPADRAAATDPPVAPAAAEQAAPAVRPDPVGEREILDALPDPFALLQAVRDADGHLVDLRIEAVNLAACDFVGLPRSALLGAPLLELMRSFGADDYFAALAAVVDGGAPLRHDGSVFSLPGAGHAQRHYDTRGIRVGDGLSLTWRDVTERFQAAEALAASEEHFRLLAENATDVVYAVGLDGRINWVSPSVQELLGWSPDDLLGRTVRELIHPDDLPGAEARREAIVAAGADRGSSELRVALEDGSWRWMNLRGKVLRADDGRVLGGIETLRDIDPEVRARQALAASEQQFRLAMRGSPEGMAVVGLDRRFLSVNPSLAKLVGRSEPWLLTHRVPDVLHPGEHASDEEVRRQLLAGDAEEQTHERRLVTADGAELWVLHAEALVRDAENRPLFFVSQFQDITARRTAETQLARAATHDPLTGLANRSLLVEEIRRSLAATRRSGHATAVLMLDLDHFKNVNDSLGHAVGDQLLCEAAERIEAVVRASDVVGRQGGDEFVVVMRDLVDAGEAVHVAERLVTTFRRPLVLGGAELFTTASVGVTVTGTAGRDADDLLREADTAMYDAKAQGRDRVSIFNDGLRSLVTERLRLGNELRGALERGELDLWYQPEVDLATGRVRAVEALLRWHHPSGELYPADRFIDVAEDTGLILEIGDWVLRQACEQAAAWARSRPAATVTVRINLSAMQLAESGLLAALDGALTASGVDATRLCVEITETALLRDLVTVHDNLAGIRARGIRVAIDDFGTGYASLAYLRDLPVDVLKVDRSFVTNITTDERDRRIVDGIIALAHRLAIPVTAEGVETEAQADLLRDLGCVGAQGWLYAPALPVAEVEHWLDALDG